MAPIRSKLMEISYSDPKFQIRLTGYADTVIIDSGTQQTISAIRFGGYPEVVRALSDAIYGGASVELKQDDSQLSGQRRPVRLHRWCLCPPRAKRYADKPWRDRGGGGNGHGSDDQSAGAACHTGHPPGSAEHPWHTLLQIRLESGV